MALGVILNSDTVHRIVLECYPEGVYVNVFRSPQSPGPEEDHYQPDIRLAKQFCKETFGVPDSAWGEVADEIWH